MTQQPNRFAPSKQVSAPKNLSVQGYIFELTKLSSLGLVFGAVFAAGILGATADALAAKQEAKYDVYAGGIHALRADLIVDTTQDGMYKIGLKAKTFGLLGRLVPWQGTFETHGWREAEAANPQLAKYKPRLHRSTAIWRGEEEVKNYRYNKDGTFAELEVIEHGRKPRKINAYKKLTDYTTDALSATLGALAQYMKSGSCDYKADVFDGKRRFEQIFKYVASEDLTKNRYNLFGGNAAMCEVEVLPKGGAWHKKPRGWMSIQEQGRAKGTMPTLWMGRMNDQDPAIPVKIRVKTDYGTLFMHLTDYKSEGKVNVAQGGH